MQKTKTEKKRFFMRKSFFLLSAFSPISSTNFCIVSYSSGVGTLASRRSRGSMVSTFSPSRGRLNTRIFLTMKEKKSSRK